MTFNWADYLTLAQQLRQLAAPTKDFSPISEAAYRAAISRAYYAVFVLCRNYILENHAATTLLDANNPKVHGEVIRFFMGQRRIKRLGLAKYL
jgi:hypothetical protein